MKYFFIIIFLLFSFSSYAENNDIFERAKEIQGEVSKDLPQKLSQTLTLHSASSSKKTVTLNAILHYTRSYLENAVDAGGVTMDSIKVKMRKFTKNTVCSFPLLKSFILIGGRIDYAYRFEDGEKYMLISIDRC